jgi:predicted dinucleotide-binding enzyme
MTRDSPRLDGILSPRDSYHGVLDAAADMGFDAVDFGGLEQDEVARALESAAQEIREAPDLLEGDE